MKIIYKIISDEKIKQMVKKERDYMLYLQKYDRELSFIIQFLMRAEKACFFSQFTSCYLRLNDYN